MCQPLDLAHYLIMLDLSTQFDSGLWGHLAAWKLSSQRRTSPGVRIAIGPCEHDDEVSTMTDLQIQYV